MVIVVVVVLFSYPKPSKAWNWSWHTPSGQPRAVAFVVTWYVLPFERERFTTLVFRTLTVLTIVVSVTVTLTSRGVVLSPMETFTPWFSTRGGVLSTRTITELLEAQSDAFVAFVTFTRIT